MAKKQPRLKKPVTTQKKPSNIIDPEQGRNKPLVWRLGRMVCDSNRKWNWCKCAEEKKMFEILQKLGDIEKMTFHELNSSKRHHSIKVEQIAKKTPTAYKELEILKLDTELSLFSLALEGKLRVWCIFRANLFSILWYDPDHDIYPKEKPHT